MKSFYSLINTWSDSSESITVFSEITYVDLYENLHTLADLTPSTHHTPYTTVNFCCWQVIIRFKTMEEVIRRANDSKYGLAAAVLTANIDKAMQVSNQIRAGTVWINCYDILESQVRRGGGGGAVGEGVVDGCVAARIGGGEAGGRG